MESSNVSIHQCSIREAYYDSLHKTSLVDDGNMEVFDVEFIITIGKLMGATKTSFDSGKPSP